MGDEFSLEDAIIILKRRFLYFLAPVLIIAPLGVIAVMLLPAKYTAQGTMLVESPQISTDFVRSTINALAQERIETIRQTVMTRERLLEIDKKFSLFPRSQGLSESERVELMRKRFDMSLIRTNAVRNSSGDATIAFTIGYTDKSPDRAYQVANEFVTLFQSEDVRQQLRGASNTTEFFEKETARLRQQIGELENSIAKYKAENSDSLPEHLNMHLDMLERATRDLNTSQTTIGTLEEEQRFLETQLLSGGSDQDGPAQELQRLQSELARLRGIYRDRHPAIQSLQSEIAALRRQMAPSKEIQDLRAALGDADAKLTALQANENSDPAAIEEAEAEVVAAREKLSAKITAEARRGATDPQGAQLEGRIAIINNRIRLLAQQRGETQKEMADLQSRIQRTPEVERGLAALTRDQENLNQEYQEILAKRKDAELAERVIEDQQAEKFSVLETPVRPDEPSSPNRPRLIVLALFASVAAGGAAALAAELLLATVRGRNHLTQIIGGHPIAVIPYIPAEEEKKRFLPFLRRPEISPSPTPETI